MRDCSVCRWFGKYDELIIDEHGEIFVGFGAPSGSQLFELGNCGRPEGPLDARTVRPMIISHPSMDGHITASEGMPVMAGSGKVSSGMVCLAFEARDSDPDDVTHVTAKDGDALDLWANPSTEETP